MQNLGPPQPPRPEFNSKKGRGPSRFRTEERQEDRKIEGNKSKIEIGPRRERDIWENLWRMGKEGLNLSP